MTIWALLGWALLAVIGLGLVAGSIYFLMYMFFYYIPQFAKKMDVKISGRCPLCGMARELGHWPGCDHWKGENLDLLIFREENRNDGQN